MTRGRGGNGAEVSEFRKTHTRRFSVTDFNVRFPVLPYTMYTERGQITNMIVIVDQAHTQVTKNYVTTESTYAQVHDPASAQPRPMTNDIWPSLGLDLVNIDVYANFINILRTVQE